MRTILFTVLLTFIIEGRIALADEAASADSIAQPTAEETAPTLTAREIMDRVESVNDAADETNRLDMTLTNKRGQTRNRVLLGWNKRTEGDNENQLVRFEEPKDVAGVGLLTWEHDDRDDDQWLYLPALKKVRRIPSADQSDSFMGTDFSYEDMRSEKLDDHAYTLLREEDVQERRCWVIEAVPSTDKQKAETGYGRRIVWVDQATHVIMQAQYFDKKDALLKEFEASELQEVQPGMWRVNRLVMRNVQKEHHTELVFADRAVNEGVADKLFTERELKRGR